jgi:hypothetical protein
MFFLKLSAEYIAPSITYLINLSILEGVFPSNLKIAKISPLFKSGDKSLLGNYRPISVLPKRNFGLNEIAKFLKSFHLNSLH